MVTVASPSPTAVTVMIAPVMATVTTSVFEDSAA